MDLTPTASTSNGNGFGQVAGGSNGNGSRMRDADEYAVAGRGHFKPSWEGSNIDRRELVRLALQAFEEMGYARTAKALEQESGFTLESETVTHFRNGVLNGDWKTVEALLYQLPQDEIADISTVLFAIRQQKFLEALERKETKAGLSILRNELKPLVGGGQPAERLHILSSLIMCSDEEDLRATAGWAGANGGSREALLQTLQLYISPSLMIPQRRLGRLLDQAQELQRSACLFHPGNEPMSLLADCDCDPNSFPSITTHVLKEHQDEVWRLAFSHNGEWLATAGKDRTAIIWRVKDDFAVEMTLEGHADEIRCIAWSPDDSLLITSAETELKVWNTKTGSSIDNPTRHEYVITALCWLPDGQGFVSGGMDGKVQGWDLNGNVTFVMPHTPSRVVDMAISPDGKRLVTVGRVSISPSGAASATSSIRTGATSTSGGSPANPPLLARYEKRLSVYDLPKRALEYEIVEAGELTSVAISKDSRFAIVAHLPDEILLVNLGDGSVLRRYTGYESGSFVTQSAYGGSSDNYVLSGGADGQIYVWHRDTGELITVLTGHGPGQVNAVAWSASGIIASASDDRTIRIWAVKPKESTTAFIRSPPHSTASLAV